MNENYNKLIELQKNYPLLTLDNIGFDKLPKKIQENHSTQIKEIEEILKETIEGFVEFNNFKPRKSGTFDIRCQYKWDISFIGVGYFNIERFKDTNNEHQDK